MIIPGERAGAAIAHPFGYERQERHERRRLHEKDHRAQDDDPHCGRLTHVLHAHAQRTKETFAGQRTDTWRMAPANEGDPRANGQHGIEGEDGLFACGSEQRTGADWAENA